ncbi:MAG: asparagine synthase C-terminal domain-containing protein [Deltaproteobacteria bacterium]
MTDYDFCISSYLAFRYVAKPGIAWKEDVLPEFPNVKTQGKFKVKTAQEVLERLRQIMKESSNFEGVGVLLSAGMDSAIIAAMLPRGTHAYTVRFVANDAIDEAPAANRVADKLGLKHSVVDVTWDDYNNSMELLMKHKKAPLHPAECGLYKAACVARKDGINVLAVGNGADSTFGGMDKLLSKDWTFNEFVTRYTFLDPSHTVKRTVSIADIYEPYRWKQGFNVMGFLKVVHGLGIIQMFENAIHAGGCSLIAPFEELALDAPLDMNRIRAGEPKYILNDVFRAVCPGFEIPVKIPFARPVTQWLKDWQGPKRPEFLECLTLDGFSGEQKWQLYCLERFLNMIEKGEI